MTKSLQIFESSLEKLSRILSKKWKVKVVYYSGIPMTCGNVIYLPKIPDDAPKEVIDAACGHLDHETAHVIFTDFECLKEIKQDSKLYLLTNHLEDPRIERLYVKMWPGAAYHLDRTFEWLLNKVSEGTVGNRGWDRLSNFGKLAYTSLVYAINDFEVNWFIKDVVEPEILKHVLECSDLIKEAVYIEGKNTSKVIAIARQILDKWASVGEPEEVDEGEHEKQEEVEVEIEVVTGSDGQTPLLDTSPLFKKPNKNCKKIRLEVTEAQIASDAEILSKHNYLSREAKTLNKTLISDYQIYTTEGDLIEILTKEDRLKYRKMLEDTSNSVSVIKSNLCRSLLSKKVNTWQRFKVRGKLDHSKLHKVVLDNKHVFKAKVFGEDFNTAVMVMVDHSQSMISGGKIHLAAQTSIVLGEVLNKLGIPFSICGFSTGGHKAAQSRIDTVPVWDRDLYSRWGDHWIGLYKDFDQSWAAASNRLSVMNQNVRYHTYDGESLRWAAQQLLQRKETRKILFWLNDGSPCPTFLDKAISCTSYLKECIKEVEKICELVAFGVMTDAVKNYYTNCIVVQNIEELPQVCLTQLGKILTRNKKQSLEMG